jgi:hypothetical protein
MSAPTPCDAGELGQMVSERSRGVAGICLGRFTTTPWSAQDRG